MSRPCTCRCRKQNSRGVGKRGGTKFASLSRRVPSLLHATVQRERRAAHCPINPHIFLAADPLYSHRCTLPDRTLWFGRAALYEERVSIRGWTWRGRYRNEIPIDEIEEVEWRPRPEGANLILHLEDESSFPLRLRKGAGLWNAKLHDLLGQSVLDSPDLPKNGSAEEESSEEGEDQETI